MGFADLYVRYANCFYRNISVVHFPLGLGGAGIPFVLSGGLCGAKGWLVGLDGGLGDGLLLLEFLDIVEPLFKFERNI